MSLPRDKARGRPFEPGNPGRPPGSRNKTTQMLDQLAEGQAEQLLQKALDLADAGDVVCLRMIMDRLWPARKGQPLQVDLPPMRTGDDLHAGMAALLTAIADGRVTPDEANALCSVFDRVLRVVELGDHERRIEALEQKMEPPT